jgi:hypothetical protein
MTRSIYIAQLYGSIHRSPDYWPADRLDRKSSSSRPLCSRSHEHLQNPPKDNYSEGLTLRLLALRQNRFCNCCPIHPRGLCTDQNRCDIYTLSKTLRGCFLQNLYEHKCTTPSTVDPGRPTPHNSGELISATGSTTERSMEVHPSQRRISCELCRRSKIKCQRMRPDDPKCVRCTLANVDCHTGQQKKVGRPKRKAFTSASAPEHSPAIERRKSSTNQRSREISSNEDAAVQHVPEISETYEVPRQVYEEVVGVPRHYPRSQPAASAFIPTMPGLELLSWPSAMSDDDCHDSLLPRASSSHILKETSSDTSWDVNAVYSSACSWDRLPLGSIHNPTLVLPDLMDQILSHNSLPWIGPEFRMASNPTSKYPLAKKRNRPLPFGIGKPPAYFIHENQFSSTPTNVSLRNITSDSSDAMARLIGIIHGLQFRSIMVRSNKSRLDLSLLVHRQGPLFIGNYSLVEYIMTSTEQLVKVVASLLNPLASTCTPEGNVPDFLVSTIIDVYSHLLSFYQIFLEHLTFRAENTARIPVIPIPGLKFNDVVVTRSATQGTLICSSIFYLLGRVEKVLGLERTATGKGLLSMGQIDMLFQRLDGSDDLAQTRGIMRPADVKKLYLQVTTILEQLALTEQWAVSQSLISY